MPNNNNPSAEEALSALQRLAESLQAKHSEIHNRLTEMILSDPLTSEAMRKEIEGNESNFRKEREIFNDYLLANEGKKLIGIDPETFTPLFADEDEEADNANGG